MRWDPVESRVLLTCLAVRIEVDVAELDLALRCTKSHAQAVLPPEKVLNADLRREMAERQADQDTMHGRYEEVRRRYTVGAAVIAAVVGVAGGAVTGSPAWLLVLNAIAGAAAGIWIIRTNCTTPALGAIALGVPQMILSAMGAAMKGAERGDGFGGAVAMFVWLFLLVAGAAMVQLNRGRAEAQRTAGTYRLATGTKTGVDLAVPVALVPAPARDRIVKASAVVGVLAVFLVWTWGGGVVAALALAGPFAAAAMAFDLKRGRRTKELGLDLGVAGLVTGIVVSMVTDLTFPGLALLAIGLLTVGTLAARWARGETN
jgi:hypothetical protein